MLGGDLHVTPTELFRMLQEIGMLVVIVLSGYVVYKLAVFIETLSQKIKASA